MTWFRVDDQFHDHPKVRKLRRVAASCNALQVRGVTADEGRAAALGVWVACGSWCGLNLSDGFAPTDVVARFDPSGVYSSLLVEAELWSSEVQDGEEGFLFHDWEDHQPTREKVLEDRAATAQRVAKHRAAKKAARAATPAASEGAGNDVGNALHPQGCNGVSNAVPTRPDPTRPSKDPRGAAGEVSPDRARDDEPPPDEPPMPSVPESHPGPAVIGPTAADAYRFVDAAIGREHPHTVRTALAIEVATQFRNGISRELVLAALVLWLEKPHLGPRALPSLISEVIRSRNRPAMKLRQAACDTAQAEVAAAFDEIRQSTAQSNLIELPRGA